MKTLPLYLLIFFLFLKSLKSSDVKTWVHSFNLSDSMNWMMNKPPCQDGQKIILPNENIVLPNRYTFGPELILPLTGSLRFKERSQISFMEKKTCSGEAQLKNIDYQYWHDPNNWKSTKYKTMIIPHLQRVPCRYDEVIFTSDTFFKVGLHHHQVEVSRLLINGISQDTASFRRIYNSDIGSLSFNINQSFFVRQDHCSDPAGCVCGNQPIQETICSMAKCDKIRCSSALRPRGHCCYDICGAIVHIDTQGEKFNLNFINDYLSTSQNNKNQMKMKLKNVYKNVITHTSRVSDNYYQVIFIDEKGDIQKAIDLATKVYNDLYDKLYMKRNIYVWMEESGVSPPSALSAIGKAFAIIFGLAIILLILFFIKKVYFGQKTTTLSGIFGTTSLPTVSTITSGIVGSSGFNFSRFNNEESGRLNLEMNRSENNGAFENLDPSALTNQQEDNPQSFENPMYEMSKETVPDKQLEEPSSIVLIPNLENDKTNEENICKEQEIISTLIESHSELAEKIDKTIENTEPKECSFDNPLITSTIVNLPSNDDVENDKNICDSGENNEKESNPDENLEKTDIDSLEPPQENDNNETLIDI